MTTQTNNQFDIGDTVIVNKRLTAVVTAIHEGKYLVKYSDGNGSDYMPSECLAKPATAENKEAQSEVLHLTGGFHTGEYEQ